jgi:hypothetical protein
MPRRVRDLVVTIAVLMVLFGALVSIDPRIRERASELSGGVSQQDWNVSTGVVEHAMTSVLAVASSFAADNTYLFSFLVVAVVLFVLMLRT